MTSDEPRPKTKHDDDRWPELGFCPLTQDNCKLRQCAWWVYKAEWCAVKSLAQNVHGLAQHGIVAYRKG